MRGSGGRPQDSGVTGHTSHPPRALAAPPEDMGYRADALTPPAAVLGEFYQRETEGGSRGLHDHGSWSWAVLHPRSGSSTHSTPKHCRSGPEAP